MAPPPFNQPMNSVDWSLHFFAAFGHADSALADQGTVGG